MLRKAVALVALLGLASSGVFSADDLDAPWWNARWEMRVPLLIEREARARDATVPVALPIGLLAMPEDINMKSLRLVTAKGEAVPFQVDDLDADGRLVEMDEFCLLVKPTTPKHLYLYISRDPKVGPVRSDKAGIKVDGLFFGNGVIKRDRRGVSVRFGKGGWTPVCRSLPCVYFDLFEFNKGIPKRWKTTDLSRGPVRAILRNRSEPVEVRGARADVTHDFFVYAGRPEVLVRTRLANLKARGKELRLRRSRFQVTNLFPGAKGEVKALARTRDGRTVDLASLGPRKTLLAPLLWVAVTTQSPSGATEGLGLLLPVKPAFWCKFSGGKQRHLFAYVRQVHSSAVPGGASLEVNIWLVPHTGGHERLTDFVQLMSSVKVFPFPIEKPKP